MRQVIASPEDLDRLERLVAASAESTTKRLGQILSTSAGLSALAQLKFSTAGCDPLNHARPLNLVEQLNQSFTYLASIAAARELFQRHPESAPFILNLGTTAGTDIASLDGRIAAETFAATDPESNDKLRKDIARVGASQAEHRYVFFLSPIAARRPAAQGVTVVRLDHASLAVLPAQNDA